LQGQPFVPKDRKKPAMTQISRHSLESVPNQDFLCHSIDAVLCRIDGIDPRVYDKTRNYLDGAVTWLSPYLTHGIINTCTVAMRVLEKHPKKSCYRLLFELAWREYFHRVWQEHGDLIFNDFYSPQSQVESAPVTLHTPTGRNQRVGFTTTYSTAIWPVTP